MGESYPNVRDGRKVVTVAGTAERLVSSTTRCRKVEIQALQTNQGAVYVGDSTVDATAGSERGTFLLPGTVLTLYIEDLYPIFLDAENSGEGVTFSYYF